MRLCGENYMFQTAVLASGSKGNSILIRTESTKILLDAGLSGKKISGFLQDLHLDETKINALLISHEHSDHIKGAGVICRKFKIPMYITEQTFLSSRHRIGNVPEGIKYFETGDKFQVGDIIINSFPSSHDVVDGANFTFQKADDKLRKLAVATDLGYSTRLMLRKFKKATSIILESNHDEKMLLEGPYPWDLKQRVKSRHGHLSNEQAVGVISRIIHPGLKNLVLAHLSEVNNDPEIARILMQEYLASINFDLNLIISSQYKATALIDI